jgi:hypothetical protein
MRFCERLIIVSFCFSTIVYVVKIESIYKSSISMIATTSDLTVQTNIPHCLQMSYDYCLVRNEVLDRDDTGGTSHNLIRPYSVSNYTFAKFHGITRCETLNDALEAIKHGTRKWIHSSITNLPSIKREKFPSYFIPHNCDLPYLSSRNACAIMNKYSYILTIGDSLTRHLRQAILIVLRRDLILGGIESSNKFGNLNPYRCRCDGQFSEHSACRQNDGLFNALRPRDLSLCPDLPGDDQFLFANIINWTEIDCLSLNNKGVLLLMQGGGHFGSGVNHTITSFVKPIISDANFMKCDVAKNLRVAWISYSSQSRSLDARYPHQSRENAIKFNDEMRSSILELIPNITIIDWWNLTMDSQTSDGFHYLTDVNLLKSIHLLTILNFLN